MYRQKAAEIKDLLKIRHQKCICIPECKTGPTWYSHDCLRLDFVAIQRSWVHNNIFGYEIKVNRGDFLRDGKWKDYLKFCTEFYFVAPGDVVDKSEVPEDVGFIEVSKNYRKLFTRKKAPYRDIEIPIEMLKYILICRSNISRTDHLDNLDIWKDWLRQRDESKQIGHNVSKKIRELVALRIEKVNSENLELQAKMECYSDIKKFLLKLGVTEDEIKNCSCWSLERKVESIFSEAKSGVPGGFRRYLNETIKNLEKMENLIDESNKRFGNAEN